MGEMFWLGIGVLCFGVCAGWLLLRKRSHFQRLPVVPRPAEVRESGSVRTVSFPAKDGTRLEGWLFTPKKAGAPVVVMAPGLTGTKEGFLEPFAWRFVEEGMAALVFDYRCFGGSEGMPRHWFDPNRHLEDYQAALAFVRGELSRDGQIDGSRVALWGSSFSGGTALVAAAHDADVDALVVQCPYLETPSHIQPRGFSLLRYIFWVTLDLSGLFPPIYVPTFGRPGEWVFAPSRENPSVSDFDGALGSRFWRALPKPPLGGWENRMLARGLASLDGFVPIEHASSVKCPALFVAARGDDMVPSSLVEQAHALAGSSDKEMLSFSCGHFDLYVGDAHSENAAAQARFLAEHLGVTKPHHDQKTEQTSRALESPA
jgi:dienelactone hydrolase